MRDVNASREAMAQQLNEIIAAMEALTRGVEELRDDVRGPVGSELREIQTRLRNLERNVERFLGSGTEPERSAAEVPDGALSSPVASGPGTLASLFGQVGEKQNEIQECLGQIRDAMEGQSEDREAELESVLSQLEKTLRVASKELDRTR